MKRVIFFLPATFFLLLLSGNNIFAQSLITSTVTSEVRQNTGYGRDFWFCIPQNSSDGDNAQKYFNVYVTSFRNTTVHFQRQGSPEVKKPVTANKVTIFTTPTPLKPSNDFGLDAELTSSGDIEINKAIHIWSDDADLSVSFLSRVPYSSDGMYVIPTIGWGKEYVVGSYASNVALPQQYDAPSEFAIVANQSGTSVQITPTQDIRKTGQPDFILHPKGITFSERLEKGECVQYKVTRAKDESWDVSGTIITSNNTVGVIGASTCPYIEPTDQACDFIMEMMQPITSWSNVYYTAPFAGRKYGGDGFLLVGTKDSQIVYQNGGSVTKINKFQPIYLYDNDLNTAIAWTSDAPFMLCQYVLGTLHKAPSIGNRNQGDPAYVVINGADQFTKKVLFQIPTIIPGSGQTTFTNNYVNILTDSNAYQEKKIVYDGVVVAPGTAPPPNVKFIQKFTIPNSILIALRIVYNVGVGALGGEGAHLVTSTKGISVYTYGYNTDDSYAWSGHLGVHSVNDPDSIPPVATTTGSCFCRSVSILDKGAKQSGLSSFVVDTVSNMFFFPDSTFTPGSGRDSAYYKMCIIDSSFEAYLAVNIFDIAGNLTKVTSTYQPKLLVFTPSTLNFGKVDSGSVKYLYDTILNTGKIPYPISSAILHLRNDNIGFSIDSIGADGILSPANGRIIRIKYLPLRKRASHDTLTLGETCQYFSLELIGNNDPDFSVTSYDFGCIDLGSYKTVTAVVAQSLFYEDLTIDSISIDDKIHFSYIGTVPFTINADSKIILQFRYLATGKEFDTTIVHFYSHEAGERTAILTGCGQVHVGVRTNEYTSHLSKSGKEYALISGALDQGNTLAILPPVPNPTDGKNSVRFVFGLSEDSPVDLALYDILGKKAAEIIHGDHLPSGIYETDFPITSSLQAGSYIYRLAGGGTVISGKLVVTK